LRITVASSVLGTSLVGGEFGHTTIGVHLGEVEGTVETAREVGDIDVERKLLVEELEHLVGGVAGHEVDTRPNVRLGRSGDEFESEGVAGGGDTVGTLVVGTVEGTVRRASGTIGAESSVPGVAGVAVGRASG
jgi:predicted ABC-type sugar transport system permease subunit